MGLTISRRSALVGGVASAIALTLAACSGNSSGVDGISVDGDTATIKIGASSQPHAQILQWVQDNLAADAGISLDIVEIEDYNIPNASLSDGSLAANFFQTPNFLEQQNEEKGYDLVAIADVHIEPMGIYTDKGYSSVDEAAEGGTIVLNNDPANTARGLKLLESAGLITLDPDVELHTTLDVTENPKKFDLIPVDGAQTPLSMADSELAVINGNYALGAGLNPSEDALVLEPSGESPYANQLVVRRADKDNEYLLKLAGLLNTEELRTYIEETWTDESVVPAF
ncbi:MULTISPECIES: MetQ/NlpA family ABC transporter substrate-binding protein [unclassified Actinomyces]|uniref:MetQ/NlpA family ABC transporter substrate-binding protein n=1 Tax=unclassified Actinomyces TaxID=2609248 RepID=UPI001374527C|nr:MULTISPECIES: MetQ/NlpA family ABC transporter substrate-binding protein [unclassified Actinomyces]MBW3068316.1 ABC transporter [Actinomyces sp. 594]NDR53689.1 ABC transporter [Actinomyces sp. 565]QHO90135.1 ABC transporter [Actinomyces sp. 432]